MTKNILQKGEQVLGMHDIKDKPTKFSKANKCFREGDIKTSLKLYKELYESDGRLSIYAQNAYLALTRAGKFEEASKLLYSALAKEPESTILNSILEGENRKHIQKNNKPLLSVIVPVYNSGKYLEKCLKSILAQKFQNFELIVVNDGSTDESLKIITNVKKIDGRVKIINNKTPSGNPGTPRNQALAVSRGAYIGFVDSDDWIEPDFYSHLMEKAIDSSADIVFTDGFNNHCNGSVDIRRYNSYDFIDPKSLAYKYHESFMIWDKVFSSKLLKVFDIQLGETKAAVDVPFIFKSYAFGHRVAFCKDYIGYNYRRESESSVTVNYRRSSDCNFEIAAFDSIESWAKYIDVSNQYFQVINFKKVSSFIYTLSVIAPKMFNGFYTKTKEHFKRIDRDLVVSFCGKTGKKHVLKKYDAVLSMSADQYKSSYRLDLAKNKKLVGSSNAPIEQKQSFYLEANNAGIMFFPDWSKRNPYQKLLYASLSKRYDIKIKGYSEKYFNRELLKSNQSSYKCIHLHWLHVFMDFSREDGADDFIDSLEFAKACGYEIIYTAHNIISHDSLYQEREAKFRKRASKYFDYVLVHGEFAKRRLVEKIGVDSRKIYIIPHGTYEGYYPNYVNRAISRKKFGINDESFVFLFFGNIKGYKGVDQLMESYSRIRKTHANTRLIVAGRVFEDETGKAIKQYLEHDESIIFHPGFIEETDAQYYFNASDIVILPYRRILTSGAALLSFSYNKPVIAPKSGLLPEIVEEGKQGYLFSSYEEMEHQMDYVINAARNGVQDKYIFSEINKKLRWSSVTTGSPFSEIFKVSNKYTDILSPNTKPNEYALVRILGNDLPFRHNENQTLTNLEYTLQNETDFNGCVKIWLLNRIIDNDKKKTIISLLEKFNKKYIDIPYVSSELTQRPFCFEDLPVDHFKLTQDYDELSERNKVIVDTAILKHKNNYIMNNNGARNTALRKGAELANWVFPWDGNCFVNDQAWEAIVTSLKARDDVQYHIVPMDRVMSNPSVVEDGYTPNPIEEPQIIFRADAELLFDENLMYGLKPKVDMLKRLGVPGIWDNWQNLYPWKKHEINYDKNAFNYVWSGWVARLFSGNQGQELDAADRAINRERGIVEFIKEQDIKEIFEGFDRNRLSFYNEDLLVKLKSNPEMIGELGLESAMRAVKESADKYMNNPCYSVVYKTTLPPSGDRKDYWHPAPYAWPNPDTKDGLPYIHKDGERVPGTRMYEPDSIKYDRTSIQKLFDETTALALAGYLFSDFRFTEKAYKLIHTWFIDPKTSMNPNLKFSQVVMGKNANNGTASGLIETKDFYFFLDAVRLVKRSSFWKPNDDAVMNRWCSEFVQWLSTSEQGIIENRAKNNHGNAYDLQVYALVAFLGDTHSMYEVIIRALSRLKSHVELDGRQPHELRRTTTAHYTSFNLHLWISLHTVIESTSGLSLINTVQHYGIQKHCSALKLAASWVLRHGFLSEWPFKQIDHFDKARYEHIFHSFVHHSSSLNDKYIRKVRGLADSKDVYFPHDGIAPFWKLSSVFVKLDSE